MNPGGLILVVDDNAATRYAVRRILERYGYTVMEAGTGAQGLEAIATQDIAALILDVNLPDMSGFEIVRRLRSKHATALLPVIHVSAASIATGDLITGLDAGANAYLIHPVDPDVLLATLRTLLRVREVERALTESQTRFREIFESVAVPIGVVDADMALRDTNRAFANFLGSEGVSDLTAFLDDGQAGALAKVRTTLRQGERWTGLIAMRVSAGLRETQWTLAPYQTPNTAILFIEDVTDQRRREREQRAKLSLANTELAREVAHHASTEAALRQAQKMEAIGKLTGGIAHDFNNLLTGIITGVELMHQKIESNQLDDIHRFTDMVMSSARSAAALTHRLLAFARRQPLNALPVDVNEVVRSLAEMLGRTIGEHITLELNLADNVLIARADRNQLENAIINLVINARDAMPQGGRIAITSLSAAIESDHELAEGNYAALSVTDNGSGMSSEVIEKAFEPFFTTKAPGQGTGLGLSMIYGFARQSSGSVRIDSQEGKGSTVTIFLPQLVASVATAETPPSLPSRGQGAHVLIVEDMPAVRMVASELLVRAGYRCTEAADAQSALKHIRGDGALDLLLTDIGLPGMDGRELADLVHAWRPKLPVLFMTGYAERATSGRDFLREREDIVVKPFEAMDLMRKIDKLLNL
ncbi:MAG: response regulator [Dyella sp.]